MECAAVAMDGEFADTGEPWPGRFWGDLRLRPVRSGVFHPPELSAVHRAHQLQAFRADCRDGLFHGRAATVCWPGRGGASEVCCRRGGPYTGIVVRVDGQEVPDI